MKVICIFSKEVARDEIKVLLSFVSNTIYKCLPKTLNVVNNDKPCRKKVNVCKSFFTNSKKIVY